MNDIEVYGRQGCGHRGALLIVDFVVGFCDPAQYGGGNIPGAVAQTKYASRRSARSAKLSSSSVSATGHDPR